MKMIGDPNIRQLAEQLMTEVVTAARQDGERLSPLVRIDAYQRI